jgi:hypothetical protein
MTLTGAFTGIVVAGLLRVGSSAGHIEPAQIPAMKAAGLGMLGTALVQVAYLGHGDRGLVSNLQMALLFSAIGGGVTLAWLSIARARSHSPGHHSTAS